MANAAKVAKKLQKAIAKGKTKKIDKRAGKLASVVNQLPSDQQQQFVGSQPESIQNLLGARGLLDTSVTSAQQQAVNPALQAQLGLLQSSGPGSIMDLVTQFLAQPAPQPVAVQTPTAPPVAVQTPTAPPVVGQQPLPQAGQLGPLGNVADRLFTPRAGQAFIPPGAFDVNRLLGLLAGTQQ